MGSMCTAVLLNFFSNIGRYRRSFPVVIDKVCFIMTGISTDCAPNATVLLFDVDSSIFAQRSTPSFPSDRDFRCERFANIRHYLEYAAFRTAISRHDSLYFTYAACTCSSCWNWRRAVCSEMAMPYSHSLAVVLSYWIIILTIYSIISQCRDVMGGGKSNERIH